MNIQTQAIGADGASESIYLLSVPDECPLCRKKITPERGSAFLNRESDQPKRKAEVIFRCPSYSCRQVFLGYYSQGPNPTLFKFEQAAPKIHVPATFSDTIKTISSDFIIIYNQAQQAEAFNLDQICGAGYRRALEFLIKDYLLTKVSDENEKEAVRKQFLGAAISTRIADSNIKGVAKRAAWLGNDEAHYVRTWEQKDLNDLKRLIDLTVHWMEAEALTNQLYKDMPDTTAAN